MLTKMKDKVLFARRAADLTQEELAERTGLSRQEISLIERGKVRPGIDTIKKIADALEVKVDDLIGNGGE